MVTSILFNRSISLSSESSLAPPQLKLDQALLSFSDQASDPYILSGMVAGSFAFRFMKSAIFASASKIFSPLGSQIFATSIGFASEVTAFEGSQRVLKVKMGGADQSLLAWKGAHGIQSGLLHSALSLGALKLGEALTAHQNIILQHGLGDAAMVFSHRLSGSLGISEKSTGSLAEDFALAEITTLQMQAGVSLVHSSFPHLILREKAIESSTKALEFAFSKTAFSSLETSLQEPALILQMASGGKRRTDPPAGGVRYRSNPQILEVIPDVFTVGTHLGKAIEAQIFRYPDGRVVVSSPSTNPTDSTVTIRMDNGTRQPEHKNLSPGERFEINTPYPTYLRRPGNYFLIERDVASNPNFEISRVGNQVTVTQNISCFMATDGYNNLYLDVRNLGRDPDAAVELRDDSNVNYEVKAGRPFQLIAGKTYLIRIPEGPNRGWKRLQDLIRR